METLVHANINPMLLNVWAVVNRCTLLEEREIIEKHPLSPLHCTPVPISGKVFKEYYSPEFNVSEFCGYLD